MLDQIREDDIVIVWKVDRLARSTRDFNVPRHVTEYECERWTRGRFAEEQILSDELITHSSGYLMREIMLHLDAVLDCGLDQRALDYLLPAHRGELLR